VLENTRKNNSLLCAVLLYVLELPTNVFQLGGRAKGYQLLTVKSAFYEILQRTSKLRFFNTVIKI
jgi:hypothetical protein